MPFIHTSLEIPEVIVIEPRVFSDERGVFFETFKQSDFSSIGINEKFLQDNQSVSRRGVLRGLHYQLPPHSQGKIVRVVAGRIFDVAVDIRRSSLTFGRWVSCELSEENNRMLYIPVGFAHGYLTLSDRAVFLYKCTEEYAHEAEAGIRWDDMDVGIQWPVDDVIVSDKDAVLPRLASAVTFS
ncbi:MAG: dTDP-4-dehydrorhamnose 3,5-epimerase [Spirochaetales bacterium]|jgi:dTDP-4-dehydrorhamnose 3,5-epimerase|nr:dTDP-4-dehydrorhamnose 3,5-epimerase [Spirochaetales bacterium]